MQPDPSHPATATTPWPRPIPCRTSDAASPRVLITTLGDVRTPLADGVFDPVADTVTFADKPPLLYYFRDHLGISFYRPIDKTHFPLPPSGWCSWYFYYQQIDADEIRRNADSLARHLAPFGARYCQIDDGWQGVGRGLGDNRDWTTTDRRFPAGMAHLAAHIRNLGLQPGIWLAPHGQSNPAVVRESAAFLLDPSGASISDTWEGKYLLDPTRPAARPYLLHLFRSLVRDGFTYFKIDGQPIVIDEYRRHAPKMSAPPSDPIAAYRNTLEWIRDAIGPDCFLLGCWGTPLPGVGIMNGSRIGPDVILSPEGWRIAARAIQRGNHLHNIVWYADPDTLLVRPPLSLDTARAWATLIGLTGQALLASDRLPDLPTDRLEILRRVFPAVDVRPLDLFDHGDALKPLWNLKVAHLGRTYDVVGCVNVDPVRSESILVRWDELGLHPDTPCHVYDFWNREYRGCWEAGYFAPVPPSGCAVLTLLQAGPAPRLLSTSRHITQGWTDLLELHEGPDTVRGRSRVIANDPYTLTFAYPRAAPTFQLHQVHAPGAAVSTADHQGWSTVTLLSERTADIEWHVSFQPATVYSFEVKPPTSPTAELAALNAIRLTWKGPYEADAGYEVSIDGRPIGITPEPRATLPGLAPDSKSITIRSVWHDGARSREAASLDLSDLFPAVLHLSDLEPASVSQGWGTLRRDRSVTGGPLQIGDVVYARGLGTHAPSDIEFALDGRYATFEAVAGIDANSGNETNKVVFEVWADGARLWHSGDLTRRDGPRTVRLDVRAARRLRLHVGESDDGRDHDHADWADARLLRMP